MNIINKFIKMFTNNNVSLLLAVIAIAISLKSFQLSQRTATLDNDDFIQKRMLILTATIDSENKVFYLKPTENDKYLLTATMIFPDDLNLQPVKIKAPDYKFSLLVLNFVISEKIEGCIERNKCQATIIDNAAIPVIIESRYTAKGINYFDHSIYIIEYIAVISDKNCEPANVEFTGILFARNLRPKENAEQTLNKLWNLNNEYSSLVFDNLTTEKSMNSDTIISACAVVIALIALTASFWESHITRMHNKLSVTPSLSIYFDFTNNNEANMYLRSTGIGPAILKKYSWVIDDEIIEVNTINDIEDIMKRLDIEDNIVSYDLFEINSCIEPSFNKSIFTIKYINKMDMLNVKRNLDSHSVTIKLEYESIYCQLFHSENSINIFTTNNRS